MTRIKHFRYVPHRKDGTPVGQPLVGHHAVYSSLVEIKPRKKAAQPEYLLQRY